MTPPSTVNPLPPPPSLRRNCGTLGGTMLVALAVAGIAFTAGCATQPVAAEASDTTKYTLEDTDRFVRLGGAANHALSCTGLMEVPLADGRTEIVANIKNRESQRVSIQADCVFKDAAGVIVEETPWQTVALPENATVAVRFTATRANTKNYTVRVRDAR